MKFILKISGFVFAMCIFVISCNENRTKTDVSNIDLKLKLYRFEKELFGLNLDSIEYCIPDLEKKHGEFFDLFNQKIINIGGTNVKDYPIYLNRFLTDFLIIEIHEKTENHFADFNPIEEDLTQAFKYYKYYFPKNEIPTIYTYISGFNQSVVVADGIIGIGLDKYLGADCDYYQKMTIPSFSRYKMKKEKIVPDVITALAIAEFPYNDSLDNVLNRMIYNGKIMYFLDQILPETHDSVKISYTPTQLEWCTQSESEMWTFLVENKILFKSDYMEIKRYFDDGPFTASFPRQSPARTGIWLGWQIVRSYMKNNTVSLNELMLDKDYQKILNLSKYRP